jgi:hypothetical protein
MKYGCARVSTEDQNPARQLRAAILERLGQALQPGEREVMQFVGLFDDQHHGLFPFQRHRQDFVVCMLGLSGQRDLTAG